MSGAILLGSLITKKLKT
uniref:Uncharacterized protein n=1 Tax=Arundo donax TaxID=35708 RepID=A0A0A8YNZ8_ARUDO